MVIIDTEKRIFSINNEDFGSLCTGAEIKITPDNPPEVILHLVSDIKFEADNCVIQDINGAAICATADSKPAIVDMSVN